MYSISVGLKRERAKKKKKKAEHNVNCSFITGYVFTNMASHLDEFHSVVFHKRILLQLCFQ